MNRQHYIIGGAIAAVIVVILGVLYYAGSGGTPDNNVFTRIANGVSVITHVETPLSPERAPDFAFRRVEVDTTRAQPEACLVFTYDVDDSGKTHYEDYLSIDPDTRIVVRVAAGRVCISGLSFNATYNITLKKGLPSKDGQKLIEDETVPVELRDKPSLVRFSGGIILPRDNSEGVPVTTVNVSKLNLKIIRVGDRLLSQIESDTVDETTLYSYSADELQNNQGSIVWQGSMDVAVVKNDSVVTQIPINDILKGKPPGAYVLLASDAAKKASASSDSGDEGDSDSDSGELATQWVVDSDIALTTFKGASGMTVFTRSYSSAKAKGGVKLTLVARNNNVVATATTDGDGRANFDAGLFNGKGGDDPVVVMAYGDAGDFSFLDLRRPAFDLTDRGVGGRETPGPVDAYVYTERGIYRPGEAVKATAMLRDRVGAAITAPLTLIATRPDGLEVGRTTVPGASLAAGSATWTVQLNKTAPHGRWQIAAFIDPKGSPVGRVAFDVADFVPQRLKVTLTPEETVLRPNTDFHIKTEARFLYGAPASALSGEGTAKITNDPDPFPEYSQYQFGRVDDKFDDVDVDVDVPETDDQGISVASGSIGDLTDTTLPLQAQISISIHEPGGRTTDKAVNIPVRTRDVAIGLLPDFQDGSVAEGARANFEAIALNGDGKRVALSGLTFSWVREDTNYQWYQDDGTWKYQAATRDRLITSGTMAIGAQGVTRLGQALPYGSYRLTITDPKSGAASSYRFYSGWSANSDGDRPDRIPVASDKPSYKPGEVAHVNIKPTTDGQALVVVAGDRVFSSRLIDAPAGGTSVDIPVDADWGPGAYVLVTDYHPLSGSTGREPVRAIGLTWLQVDNSDRTLDVSIGGAQKILPRQHLVIPVTVKGVEEGASAYLTLAAVDEGILQLTDFKSPDPVQYYFGKRRLGVNMRDDYGRLIRPEKGAVGSLREGGDSIGGRSLSVVPIKTVALFSGLVKIGPDGVAQVALDIPDFNGELRLMAVAWTDKKVGRAARPMTVRDPVVADMVLPRFLAPGDKSQAAVNIDNVEGLPGNYTAVVKAGGVVAMDGNQPQTSFTRPLKRGQRILQTIGLNGTGLGITNISLTVTGPGGFKVSRSWPIQVRAAQLDVSSDTIAPLDAGQTYTADRTLVANLVPSTASVALNVSAAHGFNDVAGLLRWLDRYPYGCIEQTTSRAMPLLYFNNLADLVKFKTDQALKPRLQDAIDSVLDMQNFGGNFGMWASGSDADPWLSVFALDFLYQAKAKNFIVPNEALKRGANWLRGAASSDSNDDNVRAYAFYVLARTGQANISDLRYFADTRSSEMKTAMAAALTGAAAAGVGDRSRASSEFALARSLIDKANPITYPTDDYGSLLRDIAGSTALASEAGQNDLIPAFLAKTDEVDMRLNATTTQEKAWMLRAAYELSRQKTKLDIVVNGQPAAPRDGAIRLSPTLAQLNNGLRFLNRGDGTVWRGAAVQGTPSIALPADANGLTLTKTVWTMSGQPADLSTLKQNDRVMVVLQGRMDHNYYRQMAVLDLLPAGLEIEMPIAGDDGKPYKWLGTLNDVTLEDARDDRFVAAFNIGSQYQDTSDAAKKKPEPQPDYRVAYIARAVTEGTYVMPAGVVEDMYAPAIRARTAMGSVTIGAGK